MGETIADDNPDIKQDMYDACKEARAAGEIKIEFIRGGHSFVQHAACIV